MRLVSTLVRAVAALAVFLIPCATAAHAQFPTQPRLEWLTIETEHFAVHTPRELEGWSRHVAERLESMRGAVAAAVGHEPPGKVQVLVQDPLNQSNGSAWPMLDFPMMVLWPVAPSPRSNIGNYEDWSRLLVTHEFAHLAQLTIPTRNPRQRFLWSLFPAPMGPVARRSPRWVIEGYATYIEGRLTGMGRPYGALRPALLRQWAIDGRTPGYGELNDSRAFYGGAYAYLYGSAFLEWLAQRGGDSSLVHMWRRMSARADRSFADAFRGVYGMTPEQAYGRFTSEVAHDALDFESRMRATLGDSAGRPRGMDGELVQRLGWNTGDPAISADGKQLAITLGSGSAPRRLVVWNTAPPPRDTARERRLALQRRLDPLDVPDSQFFPPPRRALATLRPRNGTPFEEPRFLRGGQLLLVSRAVVQGDGTQRPDLFTWDWKRDDVRRVTRGAMLRQADPSPDGVHAVAVRCTRGTCDLVLVDLATGRVRTLREGTFTEVYNRPRWSPDGKEIAVTVLHEGRWRVALTDTLGAPLRFITGTDAHHYDASFTPRGDIVAVTERGGIMNLEHVYPGEPVLLTAVTGAALAPAPAPDSSTWFLSLHAGGLDLRRLPASSPPVVAALPSPASLVGAAQPAFRTDTLRVRAAGPSRPYGIGPSQRRWLPLGSAGADGGAIALGVERSDPVGRLGALAVGALGTSGAWSGGRGALTWRGFRPELRGELFGARQSADSTGTRIGGAMARMVLRDLRPPRPQLALSFSAARVRRDSLVAGLSPLIPVTTFMRAMGAADASATISGSRGGFSASQSLSLHGDAGRSEGRSFARFIAGGTLGVKVPAFPVILAEARGGVMTGDGTFERFSLGGVRPVVLDEALLPQRIFFGPLRSGAATGSRFAQLRAAMQVGIFQPYYWTAALGEPGARLRGWTRVAGIEARYTTGPMTLVAAPGMMVVGGIAKRIEDRKIQVYIGTAVSP